MTDRFLEGKTALVTGGNSEPWKGILWDARTARRECDRSFPQLALRLLPDKALRLSPNDGLHGSWLEETTGEVAGIGLNQRFFGWEVVVEVALLMPTLSATSLVRRP
jgi:hypothetical protein